MLGRKKKAEKAKKAKPKKTTHCKDCGGKGSFDGGEVECNACKGKGRV